MTPDGLETLTRRLAELDPPPDPAPLWTLSGIALVVVLGLLLTALQLIRRRRRLRPGRSPRDAATEALALLDELEQQWRGGEIDATRLGFRLATVVRMGLELNRLDPEPPAGLEEEAAAWRALHHRLHRLRYRDGAAEPIDPALFETIRHLLGKGRGGPPC